MFGHPVTKSDFYSENKLLEKYMKTLGHSDALLMIM